MRRKITSNTKSLLIFQGAVSKTWTAMKFLNLGRWVNECCDQIHCTLYRHFSNSTRDRSGVCGQQALWFKDSIDNILYILYIIVYTYTYYVYILLYIYIYMYIPERRFPSSWLVATRDSWGNWRSRLKRRTTWRSSPQLLLQWRHGTPKITHGFEGRRTSWYYLIVDIPVYDFRKLMSIMIPWENLHILFETYSHSRKTGYLRDKWWYHWRLTSSMVHRTAAWKQAAEIKSLLGEAG